MWVYQPEVFYQKRHPIIDIHCHGGSYRAFHIPWNDAAGMIDELDACGVDVACVSTHRAISADWRRGNDLTMQYVDEFPKRLVGYAGVNPNYPHAVLPELERCFASGRVKGIKIHPELHGDYPMDGPNYRPMWEFAAERRLAVLFHTYFGGDRLEVIERLAVEYPTVTFLVGHCAVDLGLEPAAAMASRRPNVVLDITGPQGAAGVVEHLARRVPSQRLAFGSDMPFLDLGTMLGAVVHADIPAEDKEQILWRTAARVLGIEVSTNKSAVAELGGGVSA